MKCKCSNCVYHFDTDEGLACNKKLCFVKPKDVCDDWDCDELSTPERIVVFAIAVVGIVILLANFL